MEAALRAASMYLVPFMLSLLILCFIVFLIVVLIVFSLKGLTLFRRELCHNGTGVRHGSPPGNVEYKNHINYI